MIFTDRTITVRKGESRIDEPIVVYRGDYELEVRFTILNSRFKFMSGTNMIESEKASYGQLAILTPYGGNIFSDIVRCNDGSVTFVLTAEMLNQIEEVGLYSFQIRLMDYNKESRVSIPPIEFGIEVREPIASEDHDNSVNNAIVGYSIAKVVDPKEENIGDTFDESGKYNKTKWETGDRISEGKLNKIEDAIDKVNRNEKTDVAALDKRLTSNFNILSGELNYKLDRNDKISIDMIDKNKGKLDQTYLSDELLEQIAGDAAVNAVPADGSLTTKKYADNSVTGMKTDFLDVSLNLIDPHKLFDGFINNNSGSMVNNASGMIQYVTTDYIPITAGVTYYTTSYRKLLCYDLSKKPITSTYEDINTSDCVKVFDNDGYIRITYFKDHINNHAIFAKSSVPVKFQSYGYVFNDKISNIPSKFITSVDGNVIIEKSIPSEKLKMTSNGFNLYDKYTVVSGYVNEDNGVLNTDYSEIKYVTSDYIPVLPFNTYEVTSHRKLCVYDKNYSFIRGYNVEVQKAHKYVMEANDAYVRVSVKSDINDTTMLAVDKLPETYIPYGNYIRKDGDIKGIDGGLITQNSINKEAVDFIKVGNYFNPYDENIVEDALVNGIENIPWPVPGVYNASGFIDIRVSGDYVFYNVRHIWVFDERNAVVDREEDCTIGTEYVKTLDKGERVRITFWESRRYDSTIIQLGNSINFNHAVYGYVLDESISPVVRSRDIVSLDGNKIDDKSIRPDACSFIEKGKNLFNMNDITDGVFLEPNGSFSDGDSYVTSNYIPIEADTDYYISSFRKMCVYDKNRYSNEEYFVDGTNTPLVVNIPFDGYIRISIRKDYLENTQVEKGNVGTSYEAYGIRIPLLMSDNSSNISGENIPYIINLSNVDRIAAIGDSYTESHYTLKGKAYLCKLSLFSDYNWENHAQSGDTYRGNVNRIRNNQAIYGSVWTDYKPTYALMISYTNDLKYMNVEQYKNDLRAAIETIKGLGAIPILSTEYHTNFGSGIENAIFGVANEYGLDVINILPKSTVLRGKDYAPFWGGSHPGTRTNHILSDPLDNYFKRMPRPFQSIKIFRVRETTVVNSLDDLIVNTNLERAEKFKEIMIGHSALVNPEEYDACTNSRNSKVDSEYTTIMKKSRGVTFNKYALIDIILPATARDINNIQLNLVTSATTKVYIKNVLAAPFATPTFYQRFDYEGNYNIQVGDKYTSSEFGNQVFTVKEVTESGGIKSILTTPTMRVSGENGTLTKVSGNGAATINYYYTALGFASDYPIGKQNVGHWQAVTGANGTFIIDQSDLNRCMDYDKLSVLVKGSGSFDITDIQVIMDGKITKTRPTLERHHIDLGTLPSNAKQLLAEEFVGTSSQLSKWTVVGSMTPYTPDDGVLPLNCSGCVDVTTDNSISQTFNYTTFASDSKRALVRVWARYFPTIFNKDTMTYPDDSIITEDSFDYAKLNLVTKIGNNEFEMTDIVGLGWKEVEFEIFLPNQASSMSIRIESLDKDIQIAKVSVIEL